MSNCPILLRKKQSMYSYSPGISNYKTYFNIVVYSNLNSVFHNPVLSPTYFFTTIWRFHLDNIIYYAVIISTPMTYKILYISQHSLCASDIFSFKDLLFYWRVHHTSISDLDYVIYVSSSSLTSNEVISHNKIYLKTN